jgi:endogenous inhibitor of DNA gyrase (YacG/DUF329 family)
VNASDLRCPTCGRNVAARGDARPASFPFCCERCRLIDLGAWLDGKRVIAGKDLGTDDSAAYPAHR